MACEHDITERENVAADGGCPICLADDCRLQRERAEAAEAKLAEWEKHGGVGHGFWISLEQAKIESEYIDNLKAKLAQAERDWAIATEVIKVREKERDEALSVRDEMVRLRGEDAKRADASEASAAAMRAALKRWRDAFDQVAKDPNLVIYGPMFYQAKAIADRALASDAGAKVLAVVEAAREASKVLLYFAPDTPEGRLVAALKSLDSSSGEAGA